MLEEIQDYILKLLQKNKRCSVSTLLARLNKERLSNNLLLDELSWSLTNKQIFDAIFIADELLSRKVKIGTAELKYVVELADKYDLRSIFEKLGKLPSILETLKLLNGFKVKRRTCVRLLDSLYAFLRNDDAIISYFEDLFDNDGGIFRPEDIVYWLKKKDLWKFFKEKSEKVKKLSNRINLRKKLHGSRHKRLSSASLHRKYILNNIIQELSLIHI